MDRTITDIINIIQAKPLCSVNVLFVMMMSDTLTSAIVLFLEAYCLQSVFITSITKTFCKEYCT